MEEKFIFLEVLLAVQLAWISIKYRKSGSQSRSAYSFWHDLNSKHEYHIIPARLSFPKEEGREKSYCILRLWGGTRIYLSNLDLSVLENPLGSWQAGTTCPGGRII